MVDFFSSLQLLLDKLTLLPVFCLFANFIIATTVSFLSSIFLLQKNSSLNDILRLIEKFDKELSVKTRFWFLFHTFGSSILTGILATAIIHLQFKTLNFPSATIYGLLGPQVLKDKLASTAKNQGLRAAEKAVGEEVSNIKNVYLSDYQREISDIIKQESKSHDNGIAGGGVTHG